MSISTSRQLYRERINHVIDYISEHISEEITLETLASVACFSQFHFHRIFTSLVGETPRDYIERVKLEKAGNRLCMMPDKPISEIAFECGFTSNATFSRSFKKHYHLSPTQFVKQHIHDYHSLNVPAKLTRRHVNEADFSSIRVIALPFYHVAYAQMLNGYPTGIPKSWKKLLQFASAHDLLTPDTQFLGMPFDNPGITPKTKCRYRACITIPESVKLPKGEIRVTDIPAGKYACYHFKGKQEDISDAYALLYGIWLPQSGYIPDEKHLLEIYPPELHTTETCELLEYDILLPVHPL